MRVLGSAGSGVGSQVVKEAGAHEVFNHKENGYLDKVMVRNSVYMYSLFLTLKALVLFRSRISERRTVYFIVMILSKPFNAYNSLVYAWRLENFLISGCFF
jgi:hypothetical protein